MTHYIHHVPGRLRVKTLAIKRNGSQAKYIKELLEGTEGVLAIDINIVTGSILINYNPQVEDGETLLGLLRDQDYLHHVLPTEDQPGLHFGQKLGEMVVNKIVETMLERSAAALIAALI